jgi:hypothetical protein
MIYPTPLAQDSKCACGLDSLQRLAACLAAFVLPGFNGRPYILSSGFVCLLVVVALLINSTLRRQKSRVLSQHVRLIIYAWAGWVLVAIISTFVNFSAESSLNLFWGYLVPFMLFICLITLDMNRKDFQWILASLALGLALRFGYGAWVFYSDWGLPQLRDLLETRFYLQHLINYSEATFGNQGNSASILAISFPVLVLSLILVPMRKGLLALVFVSSVIVVFNIFITGSRAAILLVILVLAIGIFKLQSRWRYPLMLFLGFAALLFTAYAGDRINAQFLAILDFSSDNFGDNSMLGRFASMEYGIDIITKYPLGVGPGMSYLHNPYDVAHQFAIEQGSALGFLGMIFVLLITVIVIKQVFTLRLSRHSGADALGAVFYFGAFSWIIYAMTTNIPVNSGPTMPWIGLLAIFLALGDMADGSTSKSIELRRGNER